MSCIVNFLKISSEIQIFMCTYVILFPSLGCAIILAWCFTVFLFMIMNIIILIIVLCFLFELNLYLIFEKVLFIRVSNDSKDFFI